MTVIFDIETTEIPDSGIKDIKKIHCIAALCLETGKEYFADSTTGYASVLTMLSSANRIVAHNAIGFDVPVLKNFFPDWEPKGEMFDTLVVCRAIWHDVAVKDWGRCKDGSLPRRLLGSHSLESYGYRLGEYKGDFGKQKDAWDVYTPEMAEYCKQDVVVLSRLYDKIIDSGVSDELITNENRFAEIMLEQENTGVLFDEGKAVDLMLKLRGRKSELVDELQAVFPPVYRPVDGGKTFTALRRNKKIPGLEKGMKYCKIKLNIFNPGSRPQIAERLCALGWEPVDMTEGCSVQVNEKTLEGCRLPEADKIKEYLMVNKRLSQLSDANGAWMKKVQKDGRIHGRVNSGGCIGGRCSHNTPNLAQVPKISNPYGKECRELFHSRPGYKLVGCDASGLELRTLAHFLQPFDRGIYIDLILRGDIHTANQKAAGLPNRDTAKTFIYGWIYGAGAAKTGVIVGGGAKEGKALQNRFMKKFPAIKKLKNQVAGVVERRGYMKGVDGRRLRTRSPHSALNLLLQSSGALLMKRFAIELHDATAHLDRHFVLNCHDEIQAEVRDDHVEEYSQACLDSFIKAGEYYNFRIPIDGEVKIGENWKETH